MSKSNRFWRERCGMVRDSDVAPFCRHGDPMLVAARMVPIRPYHPWTPGRASDEDEAWLKGAA
jgi:hypothetical protein